MADADPYADLLEEDPYADLLATAPQEIAAQAKGKPLPRSALGGAIKAYGATPQGFLAGLAIDKLGLNPAPVQRAGAPVVSGAETYLNKAVNNVPLGGVTTDLGTAGSLLLAQKAGKVAPEISRALSGLTGRLLPESLQFGPVPGPGAVLTPQALKELAALGEDAKEPEAGTVDTYRRLRDTRRARTEAGEEQNPLAALGGAGTGIAASLLAPLPKFTPKGGTAANTGAKIAAGGKTGGAYGALAGLTSGDADTAGGDFADTALQGLFGGLLGSTLGAAVPAAGALGSRLLSGVVKPTPAAKALQGSGVQSMTLGQQAGPGSLLGRFEGAAQSNPVFGPVLKGQRGVGEESWRNVVANAAKAPGAEAIPQGTAMPQAMQKLNEGYGAVYDKVRDATIPTYRMDGVLKRVVDPATKIEAGASTKDIRLAADFVRTQLSRIPDGDEVVPGSIIMEARKALNQAIREESLKQSPNFPYARVLQAADDELSEGLIASLPDDVAQALRAADKQYRNYKILQRAEIAAGDTAEGQGVFSPQRLVTAVRRSTPDSVYDKGGGGPLRELAANAARSFVEPEKTGWGAAMAGGPLGYVAAPLMALANRPLPQRLMLGQTKGQQGAQRVQEALQRYLSRLNTSPQTLAPQAIFEALRNAPQENP